MQQFKTNSLTKKFIKYGFNTEKLDIVIPQKKPSVDLYSFKLLIECINNSQKHN